MNYSHCIGKTYRHPEIGTFQCHYVKLDSFQNIVIREEGKPWVFLSKCKRIKFVKKKRAQVLIDALEKIANLSINKTDATVAVEALAKYREKEVKK